MTKKLKVTPTYRDAVENNRDVWVPASGGRSSVRVYNGKRTQWVWNPFQKKHAILILDN